MGMKKILKAIWDEFIYGGHLLAIGPVIIVLVSSRLLNVTTSVVLLFAIYLITYSVYSFDRHIDAENESSELRKSKYGSARLLRVLLIFFAIFVALVLLRENTYRLLLGVFLIVLGLCYGLFFKRISSFVPGFKSFFVSLIFSSVIFFIAIQIEIVSAELILLFVFFAARWFINTSFCDIKDRSHDKQADIKTFATIFSVTAFKKFILILNIISAIPLLIGVIRYSLPVVSLLLLLPTPYYFYLFFLHDRNRVNLQTLCNVWADSEPFLWLLVVIFSRS